MRRGEATSRVLITDTDIQGCDTIMSYSDSTVPIFVLPPNFEEWMRRLDGRGAMSPSEKRRRLTSAADEIQFALERNYFKFIINWDLKLTIEELHQHILTKSFGEAEQQAAHGHAQQLLVDLANWLA
jgi:guanylate kinase